MAIKHSKVIQVIETVVEDDVQSNIEYWSTDGAFRLGSFVVPKVPQVPQIDLSEKPVLKVIDPENFPPAEK